MRKIMNITRNELEVLTFWANKSNEELKAYMKGKGEYLYFYDIDKGEVVLLDIHGIIELRDRYKQKLEKFTKQYGTFENYLKLKCPNENDKWLDRNKKWISRLNEIIPIEPTTVCAWHYNNRFGDPLDTRVTQVKDITFSSIYYPLKKNVTLYKEKEVTTIMLIEGKYYKFNDIKTLKDKYNIK